VKVTSGNLGAKCRVKEILGKTASFHRGSRIFQNLINIIVETLKDAFTFLTSLHPLPSPLMLLDTNMVQSFSKLTPMAIGTPASIFPNHSPPLNKTMYDIYP